MSHEEGYWHKETPETEPALAGCGANTMKNALANTTSTLPGQLARSVTWDCGKEMLACARFRIETGIPVFFADPQSPRQRDTNKITKRLLRQYSPNGTDLARWSADALAAVAHGLQHQAPNDAWLEDTIRGPWRAATLAPRSWCCIHRLSPVSHRWRDGSLGMVSPNEYEAVYYEDLVPESLPAQRRQRAWNGSLSQEWHFGR